MPYIHFSEQEKELAKQADIVRFLQTRGEQVKRTGKEFAWDSPAGKVTIRENQWYSQYEQTGGGAVKFLRKFFGMTYWFKPEGSSAVYEDIRFKENYFAELALRGDPDSFSRKPSRTPELTNTGSFEKCWKLIDGGWWMYKSGNSEEYFSELFICKLCEKLGLPTAHYELDGRYIRSKDFTNGAAVNFEPIRALVDDDEDYENCFHVLYGISPEIAKQYLLLLWTDSVCYNMDRHTENFGLLRDVKTGKILSLAPNYDNNIALIAKGYPSDVRRTHDGLIGFLKAFLQDCEEARELYREMRMPEITEDIIDECLDEIPIEVDREYIRTFILCGQDRVRDIIEMDGELSEDEEPDMGLTL